MAAIARTITVEIPGQTGPSPSGPLPVVGEDDTDVMTSEDFLPEADVVRDGSPGPGVDPFLGRVVAGRYDVRSVIGEGGYGRVYLAEHTLLGHPVAIKALLAEHAADPAIMARFSLEAKTAANIRHPAIVAVNDYSQTSRGVPFMVMELVEGDTLSEVIQRHGPARTDVARPLFAQVAGGLAAAHRSGVIHRDLKPENLLLTRDRSELKLVDFGLCIHWGAEERLTDHGELFGSIHYVAPERLSDAEPTAKSDVYSFGCVMFETFTGQPPFDAERQAAVARAHLEVEAPRTSVIAHQPIPDDLDDLISRCLEKDPEARPRMEEVEAVLCGRSLKRTVPFVRQEVSLVPPPPGPPGSLEVPRTPCDTDPVLVSHDALPVQRPARRRLLLLAAGGALLLVGSAAGAFVFLVSLPGS